MGILLVDLDPETMTLADLERAMRGYRCSKIDGAKVPVVRVETNGVWFVCSCDEWEGAWDVIHAPTGARLAAFEGGEEAFRKAIEFVRALPPVFGQRARWGPSGAEAVYTDPLALEVKRLLFEYGGQKLMHKIHNKG